MKWNAAARMCVCVFYTVLMFSSNIKFFYDIIIILCLLNELSSFFQVI